MFTIFYRINFQRLNLYSTCFLCFSFTSVFAIINTYYSCSWNFLLEVIKTSKVCFEWAINDSAWRVSPCSCSLNRDKAPVGGLRRCNVIHLGKSKVVFAKKKYKSEESGRWHFFHSARSISVPLFGGSAQINLALPPFPCAAARAPPTPPPRPFLSTPCSTYRFLLYGSLGSIVAIVFFSHNPRNLIITISKSHQPI